ncbi:MAG: tyrosine-type recombinase/integrase, partial [Erysipelotrichaceae bacterium]|nr:tyrosine-type recombinase/integrase [Erysipelotrichaceae bacterium]
SSFSNSDRDLLNRCILMVLYSCGLRVSELCSLERNRVYFSQGQLQIIGKGSKERIVPVNELCLQEMEQYLRFVRPPSKDPHFFLTVQGRPLNRQYVHRLIKAKAAELNLSPDLSAHAFRHAFATSLLEGQADLRAVQEMLGHADIRTTQIYTHVQKERLKKAYDKALPDLSEDW